MTFTPTFSGRTAILQIARGVRQETDRRKAYIPDYICNVVQRSLSEAGFETIPYQTDQDFNPDSDALEHAIVDPQTAIIVFASIYGSSAGLDVLSEDRMRRRLLIAGIHVLLDICQDVTLRRQIPRGYGTQLSAVLSFNDKSFPGAMGGGVLSHHPLEVSVPPLSWRDSWRLYYFYCRKVARGFVLSFRRCAAARQRQTQGAFEYSSCERFPYELVARQPTRLQLILAILGMDSVDRFKRQRIRLAQSDFAFRELPYRYSSPYLIVDSASESLPNRLKAPYAMFHEQIKSLRPELIIMHNKGFDDV